MKKHGHSATGGHDHHPSGAVLPLKHFTPKTASSPSAAQGKGPQVGTGMPKGSHADY